MAKVDNDTRMAECCRRPQKPAGRERQSRLSECVTRAGNPGPEFERYQLTELRGVM